MQIIETNDGSSSIYLEELDEFYHSPRGAISESLHVFIDAGFKEISKNELNILEVGLGTGLNAILTLQNSGEKEISYTALEPYPIEEKFLGQINYTDLLNCKIEFDLIHKSTWNEFQSITESFNFRKYKVKLENFETNDKFDLVYFDAFAPSKQPDIWSLDNLEKIKNIMSKNSIFVTYCAQGQFKRNLKSLGFKVDSLPGANGKKEMVRARV